MTSKKYHLNLKVIDNTYNILLDDDRKSGNYSGTIVSGSNIYLFCGSYAGTRYYTDGYRGKIHRATIWIDGQISRAMLPVRRKSDSAYGMYDFISNTFLPVSGTSALIAGPIVSISSNITCNDIIEN